MPRKFIKYLQPFNLFTCAQCNTHLATLSDLISKSVHPTDNVTYFFTRTVNIREGKPQTRKLLSGEAEVVDLYCNGCQGEGRDGEPIGWRYLKVQDPRMGFKEGLAVVEKRFVRKAEWIAD